MIVGVSARVLDENVGGNSRYARNVYDHLRRLGTQSVALRPSRQLPWGSPGARYALAEMTMPFWRRTAALDVLHYPADTGPVTRGRVPIVVTVHGLASRHLESVRTPTAERTWRARVARAVGVADAVITVSSSSADDVGQAFGVPADRLHVIPHGIDHDQFRQLRPDEVEDSLDHLQLPERYVLYLGNLDPRKNVSRLIAGYEAAGLVSQGIGLVVAGRAAWGADETLALMRRTPGVQYLGGVAEDAVAPLMRRADLFAFPSLYEGFGFPVIEAMASGTPVLTSERGSLAEVCGDAALFVDPASVPSIAEGLARALQPNGVTADLVRAGLENAARFSWPTSAAAHLSVFEHVAGRRR